jgi:hypothetical protein
MIGLASFFVLPLQKDVRFVLQFLLHIYICPHCESLLLAIMQFPTRTNESVSDQKIYRSISKIVQRT